MVFDTKKYIPQIYRSSRDFEALLKLLDSILTTVKYETDTLINLYVPEECKEEFLPLLAEHIGYIYNYNDSIYENRIIISNFPKMIRNRGSIIGIKLAAALSLNSIENNFSEVTDLSELNVFFDYNSGTIVVLYPRENSKVRNLLDWVRPVGMYCELVSSDIAEAYTELNISAYANVLTLPYQMDIFSQVGQSEVYDGTVAFNLPTNLLKTWEDVLSLTWEEISEYAWKDFIDEHFIQPIYITFDPDGGTLNGSSIITTYKGFTITVPTSNDCIYGINKLVGWLNSATGETVLPGATMTVTPNFNFTLTAQWEKMQQQQFIINQNLSSLNDIKIRPLFLGVICNILIEYSNDNENWTIEDTLRLTNSMNPNIYQSYTFINSTGYYRISIGYESYSYLNANNQTIITINPNVFTSELYSEATIIDLSGLDELTNVDILANFIEETVIANNDNLKTFVFPKNITSLTIPQYFLYNCTNLKTVTFPASTKCQFIYNLINNSYNTNFLYNAGINVCRNGTFTLPSNIEFLYKDYSQYSGQYIMPFRNLGIATNIIIQSYFITEGNDVLNIALSFTNLKDYKIDTVTLNSAFNLYSFNSNNKVNKLILTSICSIDEYNSSSYNLATIADEVEIRTDTNGSSSTINNYQFYDGNINSISLGNYITNFGEYTFCKLPNLESINIVSNLIPKTSFQQNDSLSNIAFLNLNSLTIQGFHNLIALTELILPSADNMNTCFYHCTNLETVTFGNYNTVDFETIFVGCDNLVNLNVSDSNYSAINNMLYSSNTLLWVPWGISDVITANNTTVIDSYSFSGCAANKLSDYILDETISSNIINYYNSITLTSNVNTIRENAFIYTNIDSLIILNPNLDLTNIDINNTQINSISGYINSTANLFAVQNNITFNAIDIVIDNINAIITEQLGDNIYS